MSTKTPHFCHKMPEKNEVKDAFLKMFSFALISKKRSIDNLIQFWDRIKLQ